MSFKVARVNKVDLRYPDGKVISGDIISNTETELWVADIMTGEYIPVPKADVARYSTSQRAPQTSA